MVSDLLSEGTNPYVDLSFLEGVHGLRALKTGSGERTRLGLKQRTG